MSLLSNTQFGFRSKLSTADAVHQLTDFIAQELDKGNKVIGIFLDLAKAFDTVPIPILLNKLENMGIRGNQLKLLSSYLNGRSQCVKIDNVISSDLENTSFGLPQGSILASTMFLIYINELCNLNLAYGKIISYADDTALLFSCSTNSEVHEYAQHGFDIVNNWLQGHLLTLNADKTKYLNFTMRKSQSAQISRAIHAHQCNHFNNSFCHCPTISYTKNIKYLGVIIDETLSFSSHIEALSNRIRKLIYVFKTLRTIADPKLVLNVYLSLCQTIINYCISSWGGACKTFMLAVERAQRAVLKVATFRPYLFPTNQLYNSCKVLTVRQLFILSIVLRQHKSLSFCAETINNRRNDIRTNIAPIKHTFASRFFVFLGPLVYKRLHHKLSIYAMNYINCKKTIQLALSSLSYEETENLLTVVK